MNTKPLLVLAAVVGLACGCATSTHVVVGRRRSAIPPRDVRLYYQPPAHYEVVALLTATGSAMGRQREVDNVVARLKREAAALGGNGVLLQGIGEHYAGAVSVGQASATAVGQSAMAFGSGVSVPVTNTQGSALAIYVTDADPVGMTPVAAATGVASERVEAAGSVTTAGRAAAGTLDPKLFQMPVETLEVPPALSAHQVAQCVISAAKVRDWRVMARDDQRVVIIHQGRGWDATVGIAWTGGQVKFYSDSTWHGHRSVPTRWLKTLRHDIEKDFRTLLAP